MKESREMLEEQLKNYEDQLRGLNSYVCELKGMTAKHGTECEHFEVDLLEAENNVKFYEGEVERVKGLLEESSSDTTFTVYKDAAGEWRWRLQAANHRIIADSGEGYQHRQDCLHAIDLVKNSKDAPVKED